MRVLIAALSLIVAASAYDAVVFSNQREIAGTTVEQLVKVATAEEPVVFIVNPDFTLGQFSVKANAYSSEPTTDYLAKSVKSSNFHESQYFTSQIEASSAQVLTSADQYKAGSAVYVLAGEEWTSMEQLAEQIISKIDNSVGVITSTDAVTHEKNRVKRLTLDGLQSTNSQNLVRYPLPVVIPPYNNSNFNIKAVASETCLFYMESITVVVQQKNDKVLNYASAYVPGSNMTYAYEDNYRTCFNSTVGNFTFRANLLLKDEVVGKHQNTDAFQLNVNDIIDIELFITADPFGYWSLTKAILHQAQITGKGSFKSAGAHEITVGSEATQYTGVNSVVGWSLACGQTQAIFFPTDEESVKIGIALNNLQIQLFNIASPEKWVAAPHFTLQTEDCTGTFSPGSWMGIVSALVLIGGLLFGYVMLQSVQTMDRFDDPKQKQIVINVRE